VRSHLEAFEVASAPRVWLPGWRFIPHGGSKAVVLALGQAGRVVGWREEEVYHPEGLHPLVLDPASPALHTLQKIRDEAHRFAITYHKRLRQKRTLTSVLDQIPGVGPTLRTNLLRHLGSARKVREASVAELAAVPKITPRLAQRIHEFFHPKPAAAAAETGGAGTGEGASS
jgi:excinuclease UvrABC nuclease subunit